MVRGHNSRGKTIAVLQPARDSVFRQILFKLGKDRGEMRVLLDPPEFGQLDLHLQVENARCRRPPLDRVLIARSRTGRATTQPLFNDCAPVSRHAMAVALHENLERKVAAPTALARE